MDCLGVFRLLVRLAVRRVGGILVGFLIEGRIFFR